MPRSDNTDLNGWTGRRYGAATWDQFDALPGGAKRFYWEAPYKYTALPMYEAMIAGKDLRGLTLLLLSRIRRDIAREALNLYGPSHPQAQR